VPQADNTAAWFALGGALGGVFLTGLASYLLARGERRHQRTLNDRADLRAALAALLDAHESLHRSSTATPRAVRAGHAEARATAVHGMWEAVERWNAAQAAIRIRLGDDHPVYRASEKLDKVNGTLTTASEAGDQVAFDKGVKDREAAMEEFVAAAVSEVGTETSS
jgi:hypothetical protein